MRRGSGVATGASVASAALPAPLAAVPARSPSCASASVLGVAPFNVSATSSGISRGELGDRLAQLVSDERLERCVGRGHGRESTTGLDGERMEKLT